MRTRLPYSIIALLTTPVLFAQTVSWDGGGDGVSWHDPLNWSADVLPGSSNDVTINLAGAAVRFQGPNAAVRSVTCSRPFVLAGGSLTAWNGFAFSSTSVGYQDGAFVGTVRLMSCALDIVPAATNAASSGASLYFEPVAAGAVVASGATTSGSSTTGSVVPPPPQAVAIAPAVANVDT